MEVRLSETFPEKANNRKQLLFYEIHLKIQYMGELIVHSELPGFTSKLDDPDLIQAKAMAINSIDAEFVIYIDVSTEGWNV